MCFSGCLGGSVKCELPCELFPLNPRGPMAHATQSVLSMCPGASWVGADLRLGPIGRVQMFLSLRG